MALTYGFGGMRDFGGRLSFAPKLPESWSRLKFPLRFHDRRVIVDLTHDAVRLTLIEGDPIAVRVFDTEVELSIDEPVELTPDDLTLGDAL
jgi:alpha,alpha-trehalose phosphorylase